MGEHGDKGGRLGEEDDTAREASRSVSEPAIEHSGGRAAQHGAEAARRRRGLQKGAWRASLSIAGPKGAIGPAYDKQRAVEPAAPPQ